MSNYLMVDLGLKQEEAGTCHIDGVNHQHDGDTMGYNWRFPIHGGTPSFDPF